MNLLTAYRYHRSPVTLWQGRGKRAAVPAHEALQRARDDMAIYRAAKAHLETMAAIKDAASPEEKDSAIEAWRKAVSALSRATRYEPESPYLSYSLQEPQNWRRRQERRAHVYKPEAFGLRFVGYASPEGRRALSRDSRGEGWFTDPYGDVFKDGTGLCYGVVYQLPASRGRARFVAGYEFGGTDGGPTLDLSTVYSSESAAYLDLSYDGVTAHDDARDAARAADGMAKAAAEKEREYQTAYALGSMYAEKAAEIPQARQEALSLIKEFKAARAALQSTGANMESAYGRLCQTIRADVRGLLAEIQAARDSMAAFARGDGPRDLCVYMGPEEQAAFCDAAGLKAFPA